MDKKIVETLGNQYTIDNWYNCKGMLSEAVVFFRKFVFWDLEQIEFVNSIVVALVGKRDQKKEFQKLVTFGEPRLTHNGQIGRALDRDGISFGRDSKVGNIWFLNPLVLSDWEDLAFSVCMLFEESVFIFQFLNNKMHKCGKRNIIVHFIIQKLKNKHTFLKKHANWES